MGAALQDVPGAIGDAGALVSVEHPLAGSTRSSTVRRDASPGSLRLRNSFVQWSVRRAVRSSRSVLGAGHGPATRSRRRRHRTMPSTPSVRDRESTNATAARADHQPARSCPSQSVGSAARTFDQDRSARRTGRHLPNVAWRGTSRIGPWVSHSAPGRSGRRWVTECRQPTAPNPDTRAGVQRLRHSFSTAKPCCNEAPCRAGGCKALRRTFTARCCITRMAPGLRPRI